MAILADQNTRLIVQGITGREGDFHARQMHAYSPRILVGGVTPGKGGQTTDYGVPVFDTVGQAVRAVGADTSVIYVPAKFAPDAIMEAADAGIRLVVCITEGIPTQDMIRARAYLDARSVTLIGPNCPGLITPGQAKIGIIPYNIVAPGHVGLVSRSGTLTYEVIHALTQAGLGQSTCVGIGGDPVHGVDFVDVIRLFNEDPHTGAIVMIGEIGGSDEERAAAYIKEHVRKPVAGFIAGRAAPPGRRMGHAGAIVEGGLGTAAGKIAALKEAGIRVADLPTQIPDLLK
jgi:succinyl-CoA synthetase alpha subunit